MQGESNSKSNIRCLVPIPACDWSLDAHWYFNIEDRCLYALPIPAPTTYRINNQSLKDLGVDVRSIDCHCIGLYTNFSICLVELGVVSCVGFRCSESILLEHSRKDHGYVGAYFNEITEEWKGSALWEKAKYITECLHEGIIADHIPNSYLNKVYLRENWDEVMCFLRDELTFILSKKYGISKSCVEDILSTCRAIPSLEEVHNVIRSKVERVRGVLTYNILSTVKDGSDVEDVLVELCLPSSISAVSYINKVKGDKAFSNSFVNAILTRVARYINKGKSVYDDSFIDKRLLAIKRLLPRGSFVLVTVGLRSDILELKKSIEKEEVEKYKDNKRML